MSGLSEEQLAVLTALGLALDVEAPHLARNPETLWQQLYNRLRWADGHTGAILEPEARRRTTPPTAPWMRLEHAPRESHALLKTLAGHNSRIQACLISPDQAYIASASDDCTVQLWDSLTGRALRALVGHTSMVTACDVSANGRYIVSGDAHGILRMWDPTTGRQLRVIHEQTRGQGARSVLDFRGDEVIRDCVFSPDGAWILSNSERTLRISDAETGAEIRTFIGHEAGIGGCAVMPGGAFIVSVDGDYTAIVWDTSTGRALLKWSVGADLITIPNVVDRQRVCVSPSGSFVAFGLPFVHRVIVWEPPTGRMRPLVHEHTVESCAVSPDDAYVVTGDSEGTLRFWELATGTEILAIPAHAGGILGCAVSPDASFVVSASRDGTLRMWDTGLQAPSQQIASDHGLSSMDDADQRNRLRQSAPSSRPDSVEALLRLPDLSSPFSRWNQEIQWCAVNPDSRYILTWKPTALERWDMDTGAVVAEFGPFASPHLQPALSPDGAYVITSPGLPHQWPPGRPLHVMAWDPQTGQVLRTVSVQSDRLAGLENGRLRVAISPAADYVVIDTPESMLAIIDALTGAEIRTLLGHFNPTRDLSLGEVDDPENIQSVVKSIGNATQATITAIAISPNGALLVSASWDGTLRVWDVATGEELRRLEEAAWVMDCAVSPDGSFVVSASWDGNLRLWDLRNGDLLAIFDGHAENVIRCAISPDGDYVVSIAADHTMRLWKASAAGATRAPVATIPFSGKPSCIAVHPWRPWVAVGNAIGELTMMDLIGVTYGSIVVTARWRDGRRMIRCPKCWMHHSVAEHQLGFETTCPSRGCALRLRVNGFVLRE